MRVRVLGAAAGGGFPQWNCACPNCAEVRAGSRRLEPRTQDSVAVSADGASWVLVNASPDILRQIERTAELQPRGPRHTPIAGIVLTNGDLDHVLGLFSLRESQPLVVHATAAVYDGLARSNAIWRTLERFAGQLTWRRLVLGEPSEVLPQVTLTPFAAPGKLPVHLMRAREASPEDNIGLVVEDRGSRRRVVIATSVGAVAPILRNLEGADALLFDGTFWSADELVRLGLSQARAEDMAHLPIGGKEGTMSLLSSLTVGRRIYTHLNNTNPVLVDGSPERRTLESAGWEVATDGMEVLP